MTTSFDTRSFHTYSQSNYIPSTLYRLLFLYVLSSSSLCQIADDDDDDDEQYLSFI